MFLLRKSVKKILLVKAFTLIEMLFVIAIIGVIIALNMLTVQQRTQQQKIEKAALQVQQILQGGLAYYEDYKLWPSVISPPSPSFGPYIPESMANPWGKLVDNVYTYKYWSADGIQFQVWVAAPTPQLALRMAAMLPNGTTGTDSSGVAVAKAFVTPSAMYQKPAINIMQMGSVSLSPSKPGINVSLVQCPAYASNHYVVVSQLETYFSDPHPSNQCNYAGYFRCRTPYFTQIIALNASYPSVDNVNIGYTNGGTTYQYTVTASPNPINVQYSFTTNNVLSSIKLNYVAYCCAKINCAP
jgi:prepilin-type N-terminal cleavage/methylation domain-containing protein